MYERHKIVICDFHYGTLTIFENLYSAKITGLKPSK